MSTHNIGFHEDLAKLSLNYYQISSNTHLISSAVYLNIYKASLFNAHQAMFIVYMMCL